MGPGTTSRRVVWVRRLAVLAALLTVAGLVIAKTGLLTGRQAPAAAAGGRMSAEQLTALFTTYGDTSGQWSGADRTASLPLPDGRLLWLFSDTFLGPVGPGHSRPRTSPFINNSAVVQRDGRLERTVHGGTPQDPAALVPTGVAGEFYWVGDATVHGEGDVHAIYNRYRRTGGGGLDFTLLGSALATFSLPDLTLTGVRPLPLSDRIAWGSELLADGGHTYIYGSEAVEGMKFAHVARVSGTDLGGAWQFWTGSGWSPEESASRRLLSGVGTAYGVQRVGDRYLLVTHENNLMFSPDFVAYTAPSPTGPFEGPDYLFRAPETDDGDIVYDAHLHPDLSRPGRLLMSYNVNSLDAEKMYSDVRVYRPRFVEVGWPRTPPDPKAVPAAPAGLVAAAEGAGNAVLNWQAPAGAPTGYRVHRRDVTAGQTHFVRLPQVVPDTHFSADFLVNGHTYEFRVSAVNAAGEGPVSGSAGATATVPPPSPPVDVRAVAGTAGEVTVSWPEQPFVRVHRVLHRDLTAGQREPVPAGSFTGTSARIGPLVHGHEYEFTVVAVGGGGLSQPSAPVTATAFQAPPGPPAGLTARSATDGTIRLAWKPPGPGVTYRVHQRDVTAGETAFRPPAPVGDATEHTARLLVHGHEYEFVVTAVNGGGEGPRSVPVRARSGYTPPQAAPANFRVLPGDRPGELKLSWDPTAAATGYWVTTRDLTAGQAGPVRSELPTLGTSTTLILLPGGHRLELTVAAFNQGGDGPATTAVEVVVP